jgi:hypothetical protein
MKALLAAAVLTSAHPLVPAFTQSEIARRVPALPYVPARLAAPSFRYWKWTHTGSALRVFFRNRAGQEIVFVAARFDGTCSAGKEKTFQLAGVKVWWGRTADAQQAWRCVVDPAGRRIKLLARTSLPPDRFADVGLGTIVASGHRLR